MSTQCLLIAVHLPEARYHGSPEWPPSPFRLFQALLAGALTGRPRSHADSLTPAFRWLESLAPPTIATPPARRTRRSEFWVPNNDLDSVGGDPSRIAKLRTAKQVQPWLLGDSPFLYLWDIDEADRHFAYAIAEEAERLYQFGRGVDMAFASAEIVSAEVADERVANHNGAVHRPGGAPRQGVALRCPVGGSFESLCAREAAQRMRLTAGQLRQAGPPRFRTTAYDASPTHLLFDLTTGGADASSFRPVPHRSVAGLVEAIRERLAKLLVRGFDEELIERVITGRRSGPADTQQRLRILPLPSIGHIHADRAIRRVLLEVPCDCPIPAQEIQWAAGAVHLGIDEDGLLVDETQPQLVSASDEDMLDHYGAARHVPALEYRVWRTVTPAALPERAARRRIDPGRIRDRSEQKGASERASEEARAICAVRDALRHAGISESVLDVQVQREPFESRGARAERFAPGTRFNKERLWHVEMTLARPIGGPVAIGDGRFLGLGLMAPDRNAQSAVLVARLQKPGSVPVSDAPALLLAARRALMARSRNERREVPPLFSGHSRSGEMLGSGRHEHVFLAADDSDADGNIDRILVAAPWACDRSVDPARRRRQAVTFENTVTAMEVIRMGRLGVAKLGPFVAPPDGDRLIGPSRVWESETPYAPTRHARRNACPRDALVADLCEECRRRGLPAPDVEILRLESGPKGGSTHAWLRLTFAVAVKGPVLLGRNSHRGGGLFAVAAVE